MPFCRQEIFSLCESINFIGCVMNIVYIFSAT